MTEFTKEQITSFRWMWIGYLKNPETKKATDYLDKGNEERCCLGHACHVLKDELDLKVSKLSESGNCYYKNSDGIAYDDEISSLPVNAIDALGLYSSIGSFHRFKIKGCDALSDLNDKTSKTPQEIGVILEADLVNETYNIFKELGS